MHKAKAAGWDVIKSDNALKTHNSLHSKFCVGTLPGVEIGLLGPANDCGDGCMEIFSVTSDQAISLGTFLVDCALKTSLDVTLVCDQFSYGSVAPHRVMNQFMTTVIDQIVFRIVEGGVTVQGHESFWLSEHSARELGRVILALSLPDHRHCWRQEDQSGLKHAMCETACSAT